MRPPCSICAKPTVAHGYCESHYRRFRRHGDPLAGRRFDLSDEERFAAKYRVDPVSGCWVWLRGLSPDGYGSFYDGTKRSNGAPMIVRAHRWSYEHFVGPIPAECEVCHRCDNPPCVNPGHLFVGTHTDNMRDSRDKGRLGSAGTLNGRAKLTDDDVTAIRQSFTGRHGEQSELARRYGLTSATVSKIVKRQTWTHLP